MFSSLGVLFSRFTVEREQEKMREKRERIRIELEEERKRLVGSRVELDQLEIKHKNNLRDIQEKEKELTRAKVMIFPNIFKS